MSNKENVVGVVEVSEDTIDSTNCYTVSEFARFLTENHQKKSGAEFTPHEAREFAINGKLPDKYGGDKLQFVTLKGTGIRYIKVIREE